MHARAREAARSTTGVSIGRDDCTVAELEDALIEAAFGPSVVLSATEEAILGWDAERVAAPQRSAQAVRERADAIGRLLRPDAVALPGRGSARVSRCRSGLGGRAPPSVVCRSERGATRLARCAGHEAGTRLRVVLEVPHIAAGRARGVRRDSFGALERRGELAALGCEPFDPLDGAGVGARLAQATCRADPLREEARSGSRLAMLVTRPSSSRARRAWLIEGTALRGDRCGNRRRRQRVRELAAAFTRAESRARTRRPPALWTCLPCVGFAALGGLRGALTAGDAWHCWLAHSLWPSCGAPRRGVLRACVVRLRRAVCALDTRLYRGARAAPGPHRGT